jgi:hypothetical protein
VLATIHPFSPALFLQTQTPNHHTHNQQTVVLHVFTPDQREQYDIESFYAAAEEVPLPFVAEGSLGGGGADGGGSGGSGSSGGGGWSTSERF